MTTVERIYNLKVHFLSYKQLNGTLNKVKAFVTWFQLFLDGNSSISTSFVSILDKLSLSSMRLNTSINVLSDFILQYYSTFDGCFVLMLLFKDYATKNQAIH